MQRRASEPKHKIDQKLIYDSVKRFPWVTHELVSKLESLDLVATDSNGAKTLVGAPPTSAMTSPVSSQATAEASRGKKAKAAFADSVVEECIPAEDLVTSKYWTFDGLSPAIVGCKLLSFAEPAILSAANLKAIIIKGKTLWNQHHHIRLVEFMNGLPPDFSISGVCRIMPKLQATVKERSEA